MSKLRYLAALMSCSVTACSAARAAEVVEGAAFVRTDASDRVVAVIDTAPADGVADTAFLFDPVEPIPGGIAPRSLPVTVRHEDGRLTIDAADGSLHLDLTVNRFPVAQRPATLVQAGRIAAVGKALQRRSNANWRISPSELNTDEFITIADPRHRGAGGNFPDELVCDHGKVEKDTVCTAGGPGAPKASRTCPPILPGVTGDSASTECDSEHYACGRCYFGVAIVVCKRRACSCNGKTDTTCFIQE